MGMIVVDRKSCEQHFPCSRLYVFCIHDIADVHSDLPLSLSMDGNTKASHYRNCGAATRGLTSSINIHYGEGDQEVRDKHNCNTLSLDRLIPAQDNAGAVDTDAAVAEPAPAAPEHEPADCTTEIHCARVDVAHQPTGVDVCGVLGTVCAHTVPVRGGFCDMLTYESYSYYIVMLITLLLRCAPTSNVRDIFVDFACQLRKSWNRFLRLGKSATGEQIEEARLEHIKQVRLLVNWMHAEGHTLKCQLTSSGRYSADCGRRYGEGTEQLWAQLKVWSHFECMSLVQALDIRGGAITDLHVSICWHSAHVLPSESPHK
jgi:hypothetical protein